jgi:HEAT repeat protein
VKIALVLALAVLGTDMGEQLGPADVRLALKRLDGDDPADVRRALGVLGEVGPFCESWFPGTQERVARFLVHRDASIRVAAVDALGRMGAVGQADGVVAVADRDPSADVREKAFEALSRFGIRRGPGVRFLKASLRSEDPEQRRRAALGLARLGGPRAERLRLLPVLIEGMGDEDIEVRRLCCAAAEELGPGAIDGLAEALGDPREKVRVGAAWVLGYMGDESHRGLPALRKALDDPAPKVRAAATRGICRICGKLFLDSPEIVGMFDDPSPLVREAVCSGLVGWSRRGKKAEDRLRQALEDPAESVRLEAAVALSYISPDDVARYVPVLLAGLRSSAAAHRRRVVWSLGMCADLARAVPGVIPALEEVARSDPDDRLRGSARGVLEKMRRERSDR